MTEHEQKRTRFIRLFKEFNEVSSDIQNDISRALLTDKTTVERLSSQLKKSDNDQAVQLDKHSHYFMAGMPLATMNHCNLFTKVLAMHSNLTGDPLMHEIFDEVNQQVFDEMEDH